MRCCTIASLRLLLPLNNKSGRTTIFIEPMRLAGLQWHIARLLFILLLLPAAVRTDGTLSPDIRISSEALGYDLQYRVYLPENVQNRENLPVLFVTDGHGYLSEGRMVRTLDRLIGKDDIQPVVVVFVDPRDPDRLASNRRNQQFFCNRLYLKFYTDELIPAIESAYTVSGRQESRSILGLSFGGLNAACFGLLGYEWFSGLGIMSPANQPVPALLEAYEKMPLLPLRIFLSTGKPDDNTQANRRFHTVLRDKGYDVHYMEVRRGHNWNNWRPLIDDFLLHFYAISGDTAPRNDRPTADPQDRRDR